MRLGLLMLPTPAVWDQAARLIDRQRRGDEQRQQGDAGVEGRGSESTIRLMSARLRIAASLSRFRWRQELMASTSASVKTRKEHWETLGTRTRGASPSNPSSPRKRTKARATSSGK